MDGTEDLVEIALFGKTASRGDFLNGKSGVQQQTAGDLQTVFPDILQRRQPEKSQEMTMQGRRGHCRQTAKFGNGDRPRTVAVQKLMDPGDAQGFRLQGFILDRQMTQPADDGHEEPVFSYGITVCFLLMEKGEKAEHRFHPPDFRRRKMQMRVGVFFAAVIAEQQFVAGAAAQIQHRQWQGIRNEQKIEDFQTSGFLESVDPARRQTEYLPPPDRLPARRFRVVQSFSVQEKNDFGILLLMRRRVVLVMEKTAQGEQQFARIEIPRVGIELILVRIIGHGQSLFSFADN